jgi:hypothetical protein
MASIPSNPKIYHITHLDNLPNIASRMELASDANRIASGLTCSLVGMSTIKQRRLTEIEVLCHPGTKVGQYVPFYFCPRSIMLFILHKANNPELTYRGGQKPIVHLEIDLYAAIRWADANRVRWAFSNGNAGAYVTSFFNDPLDLCNLDWIAIGSRDFSDPRVKEGKQAEFLMFGTLPWMLVNKIGTIDNIVATKAQAALVNTRHQPEIAAEPSWYF